MKWSIFFIILSLFGCAHKVSPELTKEFKKICWDGEGKGRLQAKRNKYLFSYESLIKASDWKLAMTFPIYGQEILNFDLNERLAHGDFYQRLLVELSKNTSYKRSFIESFAKKVSGMIYLTQTKTVSKFNVSKQNSNFEGEINLDGDLYIVTVSSDYILISSQVGKGDEVILKANVSRNDKYSRIKFALRKVGQNGPDNQVISLDLFVNECL